MGTSLQPMRVNNKLTSRSILIFLILLTITPFFSPSALAKDQQNPQSPTQDIARAGVSVVRLLVYYSLGKTTGANPPASDAECTGLGVLLSSRLKPETNTYENWILTDGNLVNSEEQATCLDASPTATLSHIDIYMNTSYSSQPLTLSLTTTPSVTCRARPAHCYEGPALFSFLSDRPQPFLDLPLASLNTESSTNVEHNALQLFSEDNTVGTLNPSNQDAKRLADYKKQVQAFLVPNVISSTGSRGLESGAPFVDKSGLLAGLYLSKAPPMTADDIQSFVKKENTSILNVKNPVHDDWNSGMDAYYTKHATTEAHTYFTKAFQANPQFDGAKRFADLTTQTIPTSARKADAPSNPTPSTPYWQLAIAAILLLLLFAFLITFMLVGLARRRRRRMAADIAHMQRLSEIKAARITAVEKEAIQQNKEVRHTNHIYNASPMQVQPPAPLQNVPIHQQSGDNQKLLPSSSPMLRCSRCGEHVRSDARFCPNCRLQLQPSALPSVQQNEVKSLISVQGYQAPEKNTRIPLKSKIQQVAPKSEPIEQEVAELEKKDQQDLDSRVGQRLGNYKLIRLLGHGGFADVYLGEHRHLKTHAAIKLLNRRLEQKAVQEFLAEARIVARLNHAHIIRILEFSVEGQELDPDQSQINIGSGTPYLVMEYAVGGTLRTLHPKGTCVPLTTVTGYVSQIADGLQYAHDEKLIHRDIKPENMLVGRNQTILLSDFGIATIAHSEHSMSTQELAGTAPYMAPEQFQGKPKTASDQYSLAVVVYEWLCGDRPFKGANQLELMYQHVSTTPPSLRQKVSSIPPTVEQVVFKALAKDPQQRFANVTDFAKALSQSI